MQNVPKPIESGKATYDACRDPTLLRAVLGLIDTAERQRAQIVLLESRLSETEHAVHLLEAELERERTA